MLGRLWLRYVAHAGYPLRVGASAMQVLVVFVYLVLLSNMPSSGSSFQPSKVCAAHTERVW